MACYRMTQAKDRGRYLPVWRDEASRERLDAWHQRFLARSETPASSVVVDTFLGASHVLVSGPEDGPPLVCLHAMRTGSAQLLSELHPLARRFRVYAPDLPGQSLHGPPVRASLTDTTLADWLAEVLDRMEVRYAGLLGISWGGFVARLAASTYPERFHALTLVVPAGIVNGSHWRGLMQMALPMLRYRLRPSEDRLKALLEPLFTTWDEEWASYTADALRDMRLDPRIPPLATDADLRELKLRMLVIGAEDDISFPGRDMVERVRRLVPNVETELLRQCKHCPPTTPQFRSWLTERVDTFMRIQPEEHRESVDA
jgi:2-hydroxy-6-oxonona-2,4-dienedioate hydrolase